MRESKCSALRPPEQTSEVGEMAKHVVWLLMAAILALVSGCAEIQHTMRFDADARGDGVDKVWPQPPEIPRYRYIGQLTGEENFVSDSTSGRNVGMKFLYWLVGLVGLGDDKIILKRPQSGVTDANGRTYVTDVSNHAVFVFDQAMGKLLVWDTARNNVQFSTPIGVALGKEGQILVADAELGRVFRLDGNGKPLGDFGAGILKRPTGLARDPVRGRIYVSDTHSHDVKVFDDNGVLQELIGQRGDGTGESEFNFPTHLAFANDKLYVSDTMNARIQVFDAQGKPLGSIGQRGLNVGNFVRPKGVTLDSFGNLYVVESYYDHLLVFNESGTFLLPIGGTGKEPGQFYLPSGVWSDKQGRIYVADMFNGRVVIFQYLGGA
jgi:DNA-binding beta-propeller fold protein YncE